MWILVYGGLFLGSGCLIGKYPNNNVSIGSNVNKDRNIQLASLYEDSIDIVRGRILDYDPLNDPLSRDQLEFLSNALNNERLKVLSGEIEPYEGQLLGPIKGVIDWGEPGSSALMDSLHNIEVFYQKNY